MAMMKSIVTAVALVVMATSAGCTCERAQAFYMLRMVEPGDAPECDVGTSGEISRSAGVWDISFGSGYSINPHVRNDLLSTADPANLRGEANHIQIEGFDFTVVTPAGIGASIPTAGFVAASGLAEASGGEYAFAGVPLFTFDVALALQNEVAPGTFFEIFVDLNPVGETLSGRNMTGDNFTYPITVCNGCLVAGCSVGGVCTAPAMGANLDFCRFGYDEPIHCSVLLGDASCN